MEALTLFVTGSLHLILWMMGKTFFPLKIYWIMMLVVLVASIVTVFIIAPIFVWIKSK